jgi:hypothetical protein
VRRWERIGKIILFSYIEWCVFGLDRFSWFDEIGISVTPLRKTCRQQA